MISDGSFDDDFSAASAPQITAENVATHGKASDIKRIITALHGNTEVQKKIGLEIAKKGQPWAVISFIDALVDAGLPQDPSLRGNFFHTVIGGVVIALLGADIAKATAALDEVLARFGDDDRQTLLNRMLRNAANAGKLDVTKILIDAGADVTADGSRALLNALSMGKIDCACLLRRHGADTAVARQTAIDIKLSADKMKAMGLQLVKLAALSGIAEDFYHATVEDTPNGYTDRAEARDRALQLFDAGDPAPLQQFLRGYLSFKRESEHKRAADDGYRHNVVEPLSKLVRTADDPYATLALALEALPLRDRLTATQLLLRHLCAAGQRPLVIDAVINNGGDIGVFGNMPLSIAVRGGHSDLALHLVYEHGANIGEAVMDGQLNGLKAEDLQKLYTFMALQNAQAPKPVANLRLSKPAGLIRKP